MENFRGSSELFALPVSFDIILHWEDKGTSKGERAESDCINYKLHWISRNAYYILKCLLLKLFQTFSLAATPKKKTLTNT